MEYSLRIHSHETSARFGANVSQMKTTEPWVWIFLSKMLFFALLYLKFKAHEVQTIFKRFLSFQIHWHQREEEQGTLTSKQEEEIQEPCWHKGQLSNTEDGADQLVPVFGWRCGYKIIQYYQHINYQLLAKSYYDLILGDFCTNCNAVFCCKNEWLSNL